MQNIIQAIQSPETATLVMSKLLEIADGQLPSDGAIAGQAVASAIFEVLELDITPVYNDLDIFIPLTGYMLSGQAEDFVSKVSSKNTLDNELVSRHEVFSSVDKYGLMSTYTQFKYSVVHTARYGMVNKIWIKMPVLSRGASIKSSRRNIVHTVIKDFDINGTQVGLWLGDAEPQIIFTEEFLQFLVTRQLEIINWNTPAHSLIRLVKKQAELKTVYVDIDEQMLLSGFNLDFFKNSLDLNILLHERFTSLYPNETMGTLFDASLGKTPIFFGDKILTDFIKYGDSLKTQFSVLKRIFIDDTSESKNVIRTHLKHEANLHTITREDSFEMFIDKLESFPRFQEAIKLSGNFSFFYENFKARRESFLAHRIDRSLDYDNLKGGLEHIFQNYKKAVEKQSDLKRNPYQIENSIQAIQQMKKQQVTSYILKNTSAFAENNLGTSNGLENTVSWMSINDFQQQSYTISKNFVTMFKKFKSQKKSVVKYYFMSQNNFDINNRLAEDATQDNEYEECNAYEAGMPQIPYHLRRDTNTGDTYHYRNIMRKFNTFDFRFAFGHSSADYEWLKKHLKQFRTHEVDTILSTATSISELITFVKEFEYWHKKYGDSLFAYIERELGSVSEFNDRIFMKDYLDYKYKKLNTVLKEKNVSVDSNGLLIRELVTGKELADEGASLHHCVAGYSSQIEHGNSLIFSVSVNQNRFTIELSAVKLNSSKEGPKTLHTVIQSHGLKNTLMYSEHVVRALVEINKVYPCFPLDGYRFASLIENRAQLVKDSDLYVKYINEGIMLPFKEAVPLELLRPHPQAIEEELPSFGKSFAKNVVNFIKNFTPLKSKIKEIEEIPEDCPF